MDKINGLGESEILFCAIVFNAYFRIFPSYRAPSFCHLEHLLWELVRLYLEPL